MTLAVAARWPFGAWAKTFAEFRFRMHDVLIVATDSRFTLLGGGHFDVGRKLYTMGNRTAIVFAGDVLAAQDALENVRKLGARHRLSLEPIVRMLPLQLERAYESEKRRRKIERLDPPGPLHVILTDCDEYGDVGIVKFSSHPSGFSPEYLRGVEALGSTKDIGIFRSAFNDHQEWLSTESPSIVLQRRVLW